MRTLKTDFKPISDSLGALGCSIKAGGSGDAHLHSQKRGRVGARALTDARPEFSAHLTIGAYLATIARAVLRPSKAALMIPPA